MDKYLNRAKELESQLKTDRRYIHQNAEAGMCLPNTTAYVKNRLMEIGLEPEEICPSGLSVLIKGDKPGKTILLRADMDADSQWGKTIIFHLRVPQMLPIPVGTIFILQCFLVQRRF